MEYKRKRPILFREERWRVGDVEEERWQMGWAIAREKGVTLIEDCTGSNLSVPDEDVQFCSKPRRRKVYEQPTLFDL